MGGEWESDESVAVLSEWVIIVTVKECDGDHLLVSVVQVISLPGHSSQIFAQTNHFGYRSTSVLLNIVYKTRG